MSNENEEGNMGTQVWQSQPLEAPRISLEFVRYQAERLNADFRRQSRLGYAIAIIAAILVALTMFWQPLVPPSEPATFISRLGNLLFLAGTVYLVFQIRQRGKMLAFRSDGQMVESLDAYRSELLRRRDFYLESWRWSVWPIVPSLAAFLIGWVIIDQRPNKLLRYGLFAGFFIVGVLLAKWHGKREGQKYQRELDALATLDKK